MSAQRYVTATHIYQVLHCPHWPYFEEHATSAERAAYRREPTKGELSRWEDGIAHEENVIRQLCGDQELTELPQAGDAVALAAQTLAAMKRGVAYIYQGTLTSGRRTGRPDILERREGESRLGNWYYVPIDAKSTRHMEKYQKLQLAFYSSLLEDAQGRFPDSAEIITPHLEHISFDPAESREEMEEVVQRLERTLDGERPDPVLRKSCSEPGCWGALCKKIAEDESDIALLYNVDMKKLAALRKLGVRTIQDAAEMDPFALSGQAPGLRQHGLEVMKVQAQSLLKKTVHIREPFVDQTQGLEIHFDIESDPPNDVDYLYGLLIRDADGDRYRYFVAESPADEERMWHDFLLWIELLPPVYTVYHFAPYEITRLKEMEDRYGGSAWLDLFRSHMVDLKHVASHGLTFPIYFYGLKYIAKFLGFSWKGDLVKTGGESVDAYETYLETHDHKILDAIIEYNRDDVLATAFLKDWLVNYASAVTTYDQPYPWEPSAA